MSQAPPPFRLTDEQVARFDAEGYLVVEDVFTEADLQPVIDEIACEVAKRVPPLLESGELSRDYAEHGFEHRLAKISAETDQIARSIWNGVLAGPAIFDLIRHPNLLDVAEQLCGPRAHCQQRIPPAPKGAVPPHGPVPWHQDSGYFEPYCDKALVLTVWLPLVDATRENGCLWVLPEVHAVAVHRHRDRPGTTYLEIVPEEMPAVEPVCVPVPKGGIPLPTNRTPHASFENETDMVRWSMDLRYQSAALPTNATLTRLQGDSVPDPEHGVPITCCPPEADFLVRSRLRPDEVVTDPAVFQAIRTNHQSQPVSRRW